MKRIRVEGLGGVPVVLQFLILDFHWEAYYTGFHHIHEALGNSAVTAYFVLNGFQNGLSMTPATFKQCDSDVTSRKSEGSDVGSRVASLFFASLVGIFRKWAALVWPLYLCTYLSAFKKGGMHFVRKTYDETEPLLTHRWFIGNALVSKPNANIPMWFVSVLAAVIPFYFLSSAFVALATPALCAVTTAMQQRDAVPYELQPPEDLDLEPNLPTKPTNPQTHPDQELAPFQKSSTSSDNSPQTIAKVTGTRERTIFENLHWLLFAVYALISAKTFLTPRRLPVTSSHETLIYRIDARIYQCLSAFHFGAACLCRLSFKTESPGASKPSTLFPRLQWAFYDFLLGIVFYFDLQVLQNLILMRRLHKNSCFAAWITLLVLWGLVQKGSAQSALLTLLRCTWVRRIQGRGSIPKWVYFSHWAFWVAFNLGRRERFPVSAAILIFWWSAVCDKFVERHFSRATSALENAAMGVCDGFLRLCQTLTAFSGSRTKAPLRVGRGFAS